MREICLLFEARLTFGALLTLAFGLALDSTAAAAAKGCAVPRILWRHVVLVAVFFGGFQALMPLIGWALGTGAGPWVQAWDHWVAFVLLVALGGHMLWEARPANAAAPARERKDFGVRVMFAVAVATSIDALAAGITLPLLHAPLLLSIATIGVTAAALSVAGLFAGRRFGLALG